jgi:ABC-type sugar transport system permease subunit
LSFFFVTGDKTWNAIATDLIWSLWLFGGFFVGLFWRFFLIENLKGLNKFIELVGQVADDFWVEFWAGLRLRLGTLRLF